MTPTIGAEIKENNHIFIPDRGYGFFVISADDNRLDKFVGKSSQKRISYGIDRIVAIYPDGRGYAWHQINACGEVVFDGQPAPENCPPKPEGY